MGKRRVEAEVLLELFSTCFLNKLKASLTGSRWDGAGTEVAFDAFLKSYLGAPSIPVTKSKASSSGACVDCLSGSQGFRHWTSLLACFLHAVCHVVSHFLAAVYDFENGSLLLCEFLCKVNYPPDYSLKKKNFVKEHFEDI